MKKKLINESDVFSVLMPRKNDTNKGSYGRLSLFCGSNKYRGAAALASEGALRSGAGIVFLLSPESVLSAVSPRLPEVICVRLDSAPSGSASAFCSGIIEEYLNSSSAFLCGCGIGNNEDTKELVFGICRKAEIPLLLDADALNCISGDPEILKSIAVTPVLTPHVGEFSRLFGMSIEEIKKDPGKAALDFSIKYRCVLVLKDSITHIASPDGRLFVNTAGNPGLARGGSGDLLSGIIASFLAQGYKPAEAAMCGVYLHAAAADRCAKRRSRYGMLPHDILDDLCDIFALRGY